MFDPIQNLIDAANKVAAELSSEDPAVVARVTSRRHILASGLRTHVKNLEVARASQATKSEAA